MYNLHGIIKRHLACAPQWFRVPISRSLFSVSTRGEHRVRYNSHSQSQTFQRVRFESALHYASYHASHHVHKEPSHTAQALRFISKQGLLIQNDHDCLDIAESSHINSNITSGSQQRVGSQDPSLPSGRTLEKVTSRTSESKDGRLQLDHSAEDSKSSYSDIIVPSLSSQTSSTDTLSGDDAKFVSSFFQHPTKQNVPTHKVDEQSVGAFVPTRSKVDLSHLNVRLRETAAHTHGRVFSSPVPVTIYRGNSGLRHILGQYAKHIEPLLHAESPTDTPSASLCHHLSDVFTPESIRTLEQRGLNVEDVVTWNWIIGAGEPELSIRRFALVQKDDADGRRPRVPLFVPLQILRSPHITATSLEILITTIESNLKYGNDWDNDSAAVLLIRLLRHARMVGVRFYEQIVSLAPQVLPVIARVNVHQDIRRLTHFYNRFLSLIALPLNRHPFLSVDAQQRAQLKVAKIMMSSPLQLSLNREGYRALARVQLMHKKTVEEQLWSGVKAPSWPPWRHDELGIDAQTEYAGQQSRVSKVIKRLLEAGYGPESIEHEAKILAGWDVDKSPTIQVRRITRRRPLAWLKDIFQDSKSQVPDVDHDVWAARVAATRSVREAWVCFYSYTQSTMDQKRQLRVYHEMFHKLFARVQHSDQTQSPSPGDGKEVFPNPVSLRDYVYVPKEPPSIDELYGQMIQDGLRPTGRLLAGLLDSSYSVEKGLDYVRESAIGEVKKDVLLHPEKYPEFAIRKMLSTLPDYLLASYIAVFTKNCVSDDIELFWPGSRSIEERGTVPLEGVKPLHFCISLLQIWQPKYMPAYHAVLEGLCVQAKTRHTSSGTRRPRDHSYTELWNMAKHVLDLQLQRGLHADLICFRKIVILLRNSMIRAPSRFSQNKEASTVAVSIAKSVFLQALHGNPNVPVFCFPINVLEAGQQPYWKDVEAMILILGFGRDYDSIADTVEWMYREQSNLHCIDAGGYKMQRLTCAIRVTMENLWNKDRGNGASREQVEHVKKQIQQWGWPADVDVEEYLQYHQSWFDGMRAAAKD